jgi:hypothetical protein
MVAKTKLASAQTSADALRPQPGDTLTHEFQASNLALTTAANDYSAELVAYSDLLLRDGARQRDAKLGPV